MATCSALGCNETQNLKYCGFCSSSNKQVYLCPAHQSILSPARVGAAIVAAPSRAVDATARLVDYGARALGLKP